MLVGVCVRGLGAALNGACQGFKTRSETPRSVLQPRGLWHGLLGLSVTSYSPLQNDGLCRLLCGSPTVIVFLNTTWKTLKNPETLTLKVLLVSPVAPVRCDSVLNWWKKTAVEKEVTNTDLDLILASLCCIEFNCKKINVPNIKCLLLLHIRTDWLTSCTTWYWNTSTLRPAPSASPSSPCPPSFRCHLLTDPDHSWNINFIATYTQYCTRHTRVLNNHMCIDRGLVTLNIIPWVKSLWLPRNLLLEGNLPCSGWMHTVWADWMILYTGFLLSLTPPSCRCSWKRSWRNAKWPITASQCASCWRRYRRTATTLQDGDRRPPSEWPMPPLWWVWEGGREGGKVSCPKFTGCRPESSFHPFVLFVLLGTFAPLSLNIHF